MAVTKACSNALTTARRVWRRPSNSDARTIAVLRYFAVRSLQKLTGRRVPIRYGDRSRIWARPGSGAGHATLEAHVPDWVEMQVWRRHLRRGDLFVDVGAHEGAYALWALELGATVIAVEPQHHLCVALRDNLGLNSYSADVLAVAVANRPGTMYLSGPDDNRRALASAGEMVAVLTLDTLLGERPIAGLKLDIEGAEPLAIEGGVRVLRKHQVQLIQLEWNRMSLETLGESRQPVVELLAAAGYETYRPDPEGRLLKVSEFEYGADVFAMPASRGGGSASSL